MRKKKDVNQGNLRSHINSRMAEKGRVFTPRLGDTRLEWRLSDQDWDKIKRGCEWEAIVTNQNDGRTWKVRGASCGSLHCFCDAVVVGPHEPKPERKITLEQVKTWFHVQSVLADRRLFVMDFDGDSVEIEDDSNFRMWVNVHKLFNIIQSGRSIQEIVSGD